MNTVPSPRVVVADLFIFVFSRVLAQSEAVPPQVLMYDDGFSPIASDIVREARIAVRHIVALGRYFGLDIRPSSAMLPSDHHISHVQRALLNAIVAE